MSKNSVLINNLLGNDRIAQSTLLVGLCLFFSLSVLYQSAQGETFLRGDCWWYQQIIVSMVEDVDLDMQNNIKGENPLGGQLALGKNGKYVPKHHILMPFVTVPFYLAFKSAGLLIFNLLMLIGLFLLIFRLNCLFIDRVSAVLTTLMYASGTLFLNYSYNYSPDIFSTLLIVAGVYLCLTSRRNLGAILLGLSVFAKISNLPLVGIVVVYTILEIIFFCENDKLNLHTRKKQVILFLLILALSLIPLLTTNWILYGSPFNTGYHRTIILGTDGQGYAYQDHSNDFNVPFLQGINNLLFSSKGLIPTNPVILTALLGILSISGLKLKRHFMLFGVVALAQFLFFVKYDHWYTSHYSNRFLMTVIVMMALFSGPFVQSVVWWVKGKIKNHQVCQ